MVLVVDHDPVQCRLLESILHKLGYKTVVREDGDAALSLLAGPDGSGIDCVVLALVMPDLSTGWTCWAGSDAPAIGDVALLDAAGEVRPLEEVEAELIRFAIGHYHGQMSEVARRLRISRSTLYRKLEALQLAPSAASAPRGAAREEQTGTAPVAAERQPRKIP